MIFRPKYSGLEDHIKQVWLMPNEEQVVEMLQKLLTRTHTCGANDFLCIKKLF